MVHLLIKQKLLIKMSLLDDLWGSSQSYEQRGNPTSKADQHFFATCVYVWQGDEVGKELGDLLFLQRKKK